LNDFISLSGQMSGQMLFNQCLEKPTGVMTHVEWILIKFSCSPTRMSKPFMSACRVQFWCELQIEFRVDY
jgi:hypothetical protein